MLKCYSGCSVSGNLACWWKRKLKVNTNGAKILRVIKKHKERSPLQEYSAQQRDLRAPLQNKKHVRPKWPARSSAICYDRIADWQRSGICGICITPLELPWRIRVTDWRDVQCLLRPPSEWPQNKHVIIWFFCFSICTCTFVCSFVCLFFCDFVH